MRVQTSTLIGAKLSWLHIFWGCKLALGVKDCALKRYEIVTFCGCKLVPLFISVYGSFREMELAMPTDLYVKALDISSANQLDAM